MQYPQHYTQPPPLPPPPYLAGLQPRPYYSHPSGPPPVSPVQSNGYYTPSLPGPSTQSRVPPISPGPAPPSRHSYYPPAGPSTGVPPPSPHQYPPVHTHQRYHSQSAAPIPLAQPPPHTIQIKQEPVEFKQPFPSPARRPSPPRLQVHIHAPPSAPPPLPPKHGSSGPYTTSATFGALGLDTYATTPYSQSPISPIHAVGTYQPPRPIPKPISIPSNTSVQPQQSPYDLAPQSAPPTFPPQFPQNVYTPRYVSRMDNSQAPASPSGRYEQSTPVTQHSLPPQAPGSAHSKDRYYEPQSMPTNNTTQPGMGMTQTNSQYPADYGEHAPMQPVFSIGPTVISVIETSQMSGDPESQFTVKCEVVFPPDQPSPNGQSMSNGQYQNEKPPRVVRLSFATEGLQTSIQDMEQAHGGMSHVLVLKCQVPAWAKVARHSSAAKVPVRIEVMLQGELESYLEVGQYQYESFSTAGRVPQYTQYQPSELLSHNPLKRSGDFLESDRAPPGQGSHPMHRRVASTGMVKYEPDGHAMYEQPTISPTEYVAPNTYPLEDNKQSVAMYASLSQPNLQRATQIPGVIPIAAAYSPIAKATLDLGSDLGNMARGWSPEEWTDRRRLVQFWRRQTGTSITAICHPISQAKWLEEQKKSGGGIVVSCIYREETNMCYVTSVDAIYLLEALVGSRFTVEEKNRIRRNLEGFRPITVSKSKPGSEEFFKLIMSFPNPKPRNIEKDVKVFPWDVLGQALKKIIGKYSASWQGSSPSPALSSSSQLPTFGAPYSTAPTPLMPMDPTPPTEHEYYMQQPTYPHEHGFDGPPGLTSGPSSDSLAYPQSASMYSLGGPQTPHLHQHMQQGTGHSDVFAHQAPYSGEYKPYPHGPAESPTRFTTSYGQSGQLGQMDYRPASDPTSNKGSLHVQTNPAVIDPALSSTSALGLHAGSSSQGYGNVSPNNITDQPTTTSPAGNHQYGGPSGPSSATQNGFYNTSDPLSPTPAYDHGTYAPMVAYGQNMSNSSVDDSQAMPPPIVKGQQAPMQPQQMQRQNSHNSAQQQLQQPEEQLSHSRQTSADLRVMYPTLPTLA